MKRSRLKFQISGSHIFRKLVGGLLVEKMQNITAEQDALDLTGKPDIGPLSWGERAHGRSLDRGGFGKNPLGKLTTDHFLEKLKNER